MFCRKRVFFNLLLKFKFFCPLRVCLKVYLLHNEQAEDLSSGNLIEIRVVEI